MNEVLNVGLYDIGEKLMMLLEFVVFLWMCLFFVFKLFLDKVCFFFLLWLILLYVVRNKDGVCCWE